MSRPEAASLDIIPAAGCGPACDCKQPTHEDSFVSIDELIRQQQDLTPVIQFALEHSNGRLPEREPSWKKLIPGGPPDSGHQFAFSVDLDRCSGCKACVTACHSLNGLSEGETWRDVGLMSGTTADTLFMQHVTTACHHCLEPGCLNGCPVNAYEKDPVTGIVRHLDDQCFGCQYCTLTCPYEVPKYHAEKGIVRKCDMCTDRLAVGEAPACVQACPHEAIAITTASVREIREATGDSSVLVPDAPKSELTRPTTVYRTARTLPENTRAIDADVDEPKEAHLPLAVMLVLTQLSVGMFVLPAVADLQPRLSFTVALIMGLAGLVASTMHLGRPQFAFRAVLGVSHSWLSREIILFGGFAAAAVSLVASLWLDAPSWLTGGLHTATALTGLAGVLASAMIYVVTGRDFWRLTQTGPRFLLSMLILGGTWIVAVTGITSESMTAEWLLPVIVVSTCLKLLVELSVLRHHRTEQTSQLTRTARLLLRHFRRALSFRVCCGFVGGILLPCLLPLTAAGSPAFTLTATASALLCVVGEFLERRTFFAACCGPRMPGGLTS